MGILKHAEFLKIMEVQEILEDVRGRLNPDSERQSDINGAKSYLSVFLTDYFNEYNQYKML